MSTDTPHNLTRVCAKADATPYEMDTGFTYYPEPETEPEPESEKPKNNKYAELWEVLSHFSYPVRINHFPFKHRR